MPVRLTHVVGPTLADETCRPARWKGATDRQDAPRSRVLQVQHHRPACLSLVLGHAMTSGGNAWLACRRARPRTQAEAEVKERHMIRLRFSDYLVFAGGISLIALSLSLAYVNPAGSASG